MIHFKPNNSKKIIVFEKKSKNAIEKVVYFDGRNNVDSFCDAILILKIDVVFVHLSIRFV